MGFERERRRRCKKLPVCKFLAMEPVPNYVRANPVSATNDNLIELQGSVGFFIVINLLTNRKVMLYYKQKAREKKFFQAFEFLGVL